MWYLCLFCPKAHSGEASTRVHFCTNTSSVWYDAFDAGLCLRTCPRASFFRPAHRHTLVRSLANFSSCRYTLWVLGGMLLILGSWLSAPRICATMSQWAEHNKEAQWQVFLLCTSSLGTFGGCLQSRSASYTACRGTQGLLALFLLQKLYSGHVLLPRLLVKTNKWHKTVPSRSLHCIPLFMHV
jgi:hypothetical protein